MMRESEDSWDEARVVVVSEGESRAGYGKSRLMPGRNMFVNERRWEPKDVLMVDIPIVLYLLSVCPPSRDVSRAGHIPRRSRACSAKV